MDILTGYFHNDLDVFYFFYGGLFAVMGIIVLLQPKKNSGFPLADSLYLLGWFGVSHGANELLEMWLIIKGQGSSALELLKLIILTTSYAFLFEFGRRGLRAVEDGWSPRLKKAAGFMSWRILPAILIVLAGLAASSHAFIKTASILSRYLLGFPGAVLTGTGLLSYYRYKADELKALRARYYFILAGLAFLLYGAAGIIPAKGDFFPADILNAETFFAFTGFPVQLVRVVCAAAIYWGMVGALRIFNWERDEIIQGVVFNNSPDCIANISLDGRLLAVNKTCTAAYEAAGPWELEGKDAAGTLAANAHGFFESVGRAAKGEAVKIQYSSAGKTGGELLWDAVVSPVRGVDGRIKSVICVAKDITEQQAAREKLRRNQDTQTTINEILSLAIENVPLEGVLERVLDRILTIPWLGVQKKGAILLTDPTGKYLIMKAQRGMEDGLARVCANVPFGHCLCGKAALSGQLLFAEEVDERHEIRREGMAPHGHYCLPIRSRNRVEGVLTLYVPGGHKYDRNEHEFLEAVCAIIAKMLDYKNLEAKTYQVQKMESLGRLAGAITHDFNNILAGVKGFAALARESLPASSSARRYLNEALSGIDNGAGLIQQILAFSRNQPSEMAVLDLNALITDMAPMLKMLLSQKIRLRLSLAREPLRITGNKGQLEQIIANLAVNARDAMPKNGEFSITTLAIGPGSGLACPQDFGPCGRAVRLSVSDTGSGIPENLIERIFEPFFTTKPEGEGTGLGLSTVYSLVKLHKGAISVTSLVNNGTTFDICFPEAGQEAEADRGAGELASLSSRSSH